MKPLSEWHRADSKDAEVLRRCKAAIFAAVGPARVILYGSRARQEMPWDHDMDLLVLLPGPAADEVKSRIRGLLYDIELDSGVVISSIILNEADFHPAGDDWSTPWSRNVDREGILA